MCLANVYLSQNDALELVCSNASSIISDSEGFVITDLLGRVFGVSGRITEVDLTGNKIIILADS